MDAYSPKKNILPSFFKKNIHLVNMGKVTLPKHFADIMFNLQAEGTRSYFSNRNISQWTFDSYVTHFVTKNLDEDTIERNYQRDLAWLKTRDIPREVKRYVGRLEKQFSEDKDKKIPQQKPNNAVIIHGDNNGMVNSIGTINNNTKRPHTDDNDNGSPPPLKQQKTTDAVDDFFSGNTSGDYDECVTLPNTSGVLDHKEFHIGEEPQEGCSDLATKFHHYKKAVKDLARKEQMFYDTHINEVMTLNHCLLLKRHQFSNTQKKIFNPDFLASLHTRILNEKCSYRHEVNFEFVMKIKKLTKPLDDPAPNIITMVKDVNKMLCDYEPFTFEYRFIRCIQNIIEDFPSVAMKESLGEHDVISLVIDLILRPLLSSNTQRLRWPETNAKERVCRTKRLARPDSILSKIDSLAFSNSRMFGEVKGWDASDNLCAIDLMRLVKFAKDTIDTTRVDKVMVFHAIGTSLTFYNVLLYDEGVYVVAEINKICLPTSQQEAPKLVDQIDKLYNIYLDLQKTGTLDTDFFDRCTRETTDTPVLDNILDKSRAKRFCLTHFN
ncbi:hypothetical protein BDA99DRAFT_495467 [Phascolomyces articulosus]|uniref:Uncharacterized protein n=1 Tax=Phascolomyces articulosus TaxID=60185 RepID=A0AAD5PID0_9FUNG|nr:hypothetical protein BDA99DRAFT_495467 [Phascolomyces articulosus]